MIDSSEKRNRRLASKLQNSHVCETRCDPNLRSTVYKKTHCFFHKMKNEGGVRVCGDAVLLDFWCGFAVIFILSCGIAVLQNQAVCIM